MPMVWNEAADAKLFTAVLATSDVKLDYKKLAEFMGSDCTAKAITHRIANIKKVVKDSEVNGAAPSPAPKTPKTPKTSKGGGTKRKSTKTTTREDDAEDSDDSPSKAKKAKTPCKPKANGKATTTGATTGPGNHEAVKGDEAIQDEEEEGNGVDGENGGEEA